jgi:choline dehydrogenase
MLSGIGDEAELKNLAIDVVQPLPGVGQNLQDQLIPFVVWNLAKLDPNHITVMDNNVFADGLPGEAAGGDSSGPSYEVQTFYMKNNPGFPPNSFAVGAIVLHPNSRGSVTLNSSSFLDPPLVQPNLFCSPDDVTTTLNGLKMVREMANAFAKTGWIGKELMPGPNVVTDQQLIAYIQDTAVPDFHFVGTCKMGAQTDPSAVVDELLQVHGVTGLRVADASIMPFVPSGNTNAPSIMIGGRCGELLASEQRATLVEP